MEDSSQPSGDMVTHRTVPDGKDERPSSQAVDTTTLPSGKPHHEKACLRGLQPGMTETSLHRDTS